MFIYFLMLRGAYFLAENNQLLEFELEREIEFEFMKKLYLLGSEPLLGKFAA